MIDIGAPDPSGEPTGCRATDPALGSTPILSGAFPTLLGNRWPDRRAARQPGDPDLELRRPGYRLRVMRQPDHPPRWCIPLPAPSPARAARPNAQGADAPGDSVSLVWVPIPGEPGVAHVIPAIIAGTGGGCRADSVMQIGSDGDHTYSLRTYRKVAAGGALYIGVVAAAHHFRTRGRDVTANLGSKWSALGFRACTSQEGVHLTVWAGQPLRSRRLWHWYVHFDFDTEPRCVAADY